MAATLSYGPSPRSHERYRRAEARLAEGGTRGDERELGAAVVVPGHPAPHEPVDVERARHARERTESELRSDPDNDELKAALQRAEVRLEEFAEGTPTAKDAAAAVGCELGQIVKSLVFDCDGRPVVALVPGDRLADSDKIARAAGARFARIAGSDEVRDATGFEPGAV